MVLAPGVVGIFEVWLSLSLSLSLYIYIYIYIYTYMRLEPCGAPDFGIFYVEKGVFTCTRVHVLKKQVLSCRREHHFMT